MNGSTQPRGVLVARTVRGHQGAVNHVAVTPDGRRAVSASDDRTLKVWDPRTGQPMFTFGGHRGKVTGVEIAPHGDVAVSQAADGTTRVWDLGDGRTRAVLKGHCYHTSFTPDGQCGCSVVRNRTLKVWDLRSGRDVAQTECEDPFEDARETPWVTTRTFTPDGSIVLYGMHGGTVGAWHPATGRNARFAERHHGVVIALAVSADGRRAMTASLDQTVMLWDVAEGRCVSATWAHGPGVFGLLPVPDGRSAVSYSVDGTYKVWDLDTGRLVRELTIGGDTLCEVTLMPDGKRVVSAEASELQVADLTTGEVVATFGGDGDIWCCAVTTDGTIVTGDEGGNVHFLTLAEG